MRLEQRIGRVDRIGQTRPVHAFHLIARRHRRGAHPRSAQGESPRRADIGAADPLGEDDEAAIARGVFGRGPDEKRPRGRTR